MALQLASQEFGEGKPLLILHGLFGSARNWTGIARRLGQDWRVHALDLRNHGASPWDDSMAYGDMADDVAAYIRDRGLGPVAVLGHSMGGKAAMLLALQRPELVTRLVVADIAPVTYAHGHLGLIAAMQSVDLEPYQRRGAVDEALRERIPETPVRQFLLHNLVDENGRLRWRVNLPVLATHMSELTSFPEIAAGTAYAGPTLFLAGGASGYVRDEHRSAVLALFPAAEFETIAGAGHWLHAEKPEEFIGHVRRFLSRAA